MVKNAAQLDDTHDTERRGRELPPVRVDYRRHYSRWHDDTDQHFEQMADGYEQKLSGLLGDVSGGSALEIGCGTGFCLGALRRMGLGRVEGIDSDAGQVEASRSRSLPARHVPIAKFQAYSEANSAAFDYVLMFDVLEHVPGEARLDFLREVWSMLKPGGRLVCQVPNANSIVASRYRYIDATHHVSFTEASLDFELHRAGFDEIVISEADPIRRPWWRRPREVMRWGLHKAMRYAIRQCYALEIGTRDAWRMPLTPNILGIAVRR